jgi:hypothetical protein
MKINLKDDLPMTTVTVVYQASRLIVPDVLIDTGSASTIFAADVVARVGLAPAPGDILHTIRGVGGREVVYTRELDLLLIGDEGIAQFGIEIGGMNYGFPINGILGMDYLTRMGAILNLRRLELSFEPAAT